MSPRKDCPPGSNSLPSAVGGCGRSILSTAQWGQIAHSLKLSDRELQTVQSIFDDQTEAGIARTLGISAHTVHTHLERLYRKLGITGRCAVVVRVFAEYLSLEQGLHGGGQTGNPMARLEPSAPSPPGGGPLPG